MRTRTIIAVLLLSIATALFLLVPERGQVTEKPSIVQSEAQATRAAEKEPEEQAPSEDSIDQAGSEIVDPERERLEAIKAEWITESYAKNVELTQRKNRSTVGKKFEWLDRSFLPDDAFQHIMQQIPTLPPVGANTIHMDEGEDIFPLTREYVSAHLGRSVSWAYPPVKGMETDDYFLFSGGTAQWAIYDFSYGIAVDRKTGVLHTWRSKEHLQRSKELEKLTEQEHREIMERVNAQQEAENRQRQK